MIQTRARIQRWKTFIWFLLETVSNLHHLDQMRKNVLHVVLEKPLWSCICICRLQKNHFYFHLFSLFTFINLLD